MKKVTLGTIAFILVSLVGIGVIGQHAPAYAKGITLRYSHGYPVGTKEAPYDLHKLALLFKEYAEKYTDGRVKTNIFPAEQLFKAKQEIDVRAGLMCLVDDDRVVLVEAAIALRLSEQDAVGHDLDERVGTDRVDDLEELVGDVVRARVCARVTRAELVDAGTALRPLADVPEVSDDFLAPRVVHGRAS